MSMVNRLTDCYIDLWMTIGELQNGLVGKFLLNNICQPDIAFECILLRDRPVVCLSIDVMYTRISMCASQV